jgi:membrane protein
MAMGAWELAKDTVKGFIADDALSHGASIAYYTLFAVAPVLLIIIAIAALVFGQDAAEAAIVAQLSGLMGESTAKASKRSCTRWATATAESGPRWSTPAR